MPGPKRKGIGKVSWAGKLGGCLLALLFGLGFGAGGVLGGIRPLSGELSGWWQARDFVPVQAQVLEARLDRRVDEETIYQAQARFSYAFQGQHYQSNRIGFGRGYDNIGEWQRADYEALRRAQEAGTAVTLWVDPAHPRHAVFDRHIRWSRVIFLLPFATLFPLVGFAGLWIFVNLLLAPLGRDEDPAQDPEWWREELDLDNGCLQSRSGEGGMPGFFVLFWNLLSWPIAILAWQGSGLGVKALVSLFPLLGTWMLQHWGRQRLMQLRFGLPRLQLSLPLQKGVSTGTVLLFPRMPQAVKVVCRLLCRRVDSRGDDTSRTELWSENQSFTSQASHRGWQQGVSLRPVTGKPASDPTHGNLYVEWLLEVSINGWTREFWLPVLGSAEKPEEPPLFESVARARALLEEARNPARPAMSSAQTVESMGAMQGLIVCVVLGLLLWIVLVALKG